MGKLFIIFLLLILSLLILSSIVVGQSADTVQICRISVVPYGYVIVGITTTEQCRSTVDLPERDNTWVIKKPGLRETICENSPYPNNYAVIVRTRSRSCLNGEDESRNNALLIERLK
jgi:hypothetical protein